MSVVERMLTAATSSDLGEADGDVLADIDVVGACGMAAQKHSTALAVWRLIELGDHRSLHAAVTGLLVEATRLGAEKPYTTAAAVLSWMADPTCGHCHGRGYELLPHLSRPTLSDHACVHCHGTGKRPTGWSEDARALYDRLQVMQGAAIGAVVRNLKD